MFKKQQKIRDWNKHERLSDWYADVRKVAEGPKYVGYIVES